MKPAPPVTRIRTPVRLKEWSREARRPRGTVPYGGEAARPIAEDVNRPITSSDPARGVAVLDRELGGVVGIHRERPGDAERRVERGDRRAGHARHPLGI